MNDLDNAVIVDLEPTTAICQAEVEAAKRMIVRTRERFGLDPVRLAADTGCGSAGILGWLVYGRGIEPHVSVFDKSVRRDGTFERSAFTYDPPGDVYFCPTGKMLTTKGILVDDGATRLYRGNRFDCRTCDLEERCTPREPARKVSRSIFEGARDMAPDIMNREAGLASKRQRKKSRCCLRISSGS